MRYAYTRSQQITQTQNGYLITLPGPSDNLSSSPPTIKHIFIWFPGQVLTAFRLFKLLPSSTIVWLQMEVTGREGEVNVAICCHVNTIKEYGPLNECQLLTMDLPKHSKKKIHLANI